MRVTPPGPAAEGLGVAAHGSGLPAPGPGPAAYGSRQFWTAYAQVYDVAWESPVTAQVARAIRGHLPRAGLTVDLGCGTGLIAAGLGDSGRPVLGVDSTPAMVARAVGRGRVDSAVVARAEHTGLTAGCAAAVVAVNVLHVVSDPAAVLDEAVRLAAPGAVLALVWPAAGVTPARLRRAESQLGWGLGRRSRAAAARSAVAVPGLALHIRKHSSGQLRAVVREAADRHGLRTVLEETFRGCQHLCVIHA